MNYGLYLSSAGLLSNLHRQDTAANNLSNVSTVGFKRNLTAFRHREPEAIEDGFPRDAHALLDRLGGGVWQHQTMLDASPGTMTPTGNDLDLAIEGEGFFAVRDPAEPNAGPRLTRDGRLTVAPDGRLVTSTGQYPLLDTEGEPIVVDPSMTIQIDELGVVRQDGGAAGRIQLLSVEDPAQLEHLGEGLYQPDPAANIEPDPAAGLIRQGFVEQSNVDPIREMLQLIESSRAIQSNANLIRYHDQVMQQAANTLGRVA